MPQFKTPYSDLDRLSDLLLRSAQLGAKMALQEAGIIKTTITRAEIKKLYGEEFAKECRYSNKIKWIPLNRLNPGAQVYCSRIEFERYLFTREFDFTKK